MPSERRDAPSPERRSAFALVVLGARVEVAENGHLAGALGRRTATAARAFSTFVNEGAAPILVIVSGGRTWSGVTEADAMARDLEKHGVPAPFIVRERCSLNTRDNAAFTAALLRRRGLDQVTVVTCAWHLRRATRLFQRESLVVEGIPAPAPDAWFWKRLYRWGRERVAARLDGVG